LRYAEDFLFYLNSFIIDHVQNTVKVLAPPGSFESSAASQMLGSKLKDEMTLVSPTARSLGQRERNKIDKLRRIKHAGRELFVAKGFDDTTTREIALRASVGLGTIFVYAENKRDLLFLIVNEDLETVTEEAEASINPNVPFLDNLLRVAELHYAFFGRQPALSRLVLREMAFYDSGAQARRFLNTRERLINLFGKIVTLAVERGSLSPDETPQFIGWTIFCIFQVEMRRWLSHDQPIVRNGLDALARAFTLFATGLKPNAQALGVALSSGARRKKTKSRIKSPQGR
jgi:AcrR family transcriptional regulator